MADIEWQPLPALWPEPAVWTDVGEQMLLVFTQDGVPTWEVSRRAKVGSSRGGKGRGTLRSKGAVPQLKSGDGSG
jgi:hypothetical protein